jgi:hypothetical protein
MKKSAKVMRQQSFEPVWETPNRQTNLDAKAKSKEIHQSKGTTNSSKKDNPFKKFQISVKLFFLYVCTPRAAVP